MSARHKRKQPISQIRDVDFAYCQDTMVSGNELLKSGAVRIQLMAEHIYKPGVLIRDVFFEGGDVLRCYRGSFRFDLEGCAPVEIHEGETIVIYPNQRVTIEALDEVNLLVYAIFAGTGLVQYFDQLGFYNGIHGNTSTQLEVFREVKHRFESDKSVSACELMARLSDALVTYSHDLYENGNALLGAAIRQIRANLKDGIVRLDPLCEQLHITRAYLHRVFVNAGLVSPSEFIRKEQLACAMRLLRETRLPISEVAEKSGFISITHFANFIRKHAGKTASEIRLGNICIPIEK